MTYARKRIALGLLVLPLVGNCSKDDGPAMMVPLPGPPLSEAVTRGLLVQTTATRARVVVEAAGDGIGFAENENSFVQKLGGRVTAVPLVTKSAPAVQMLAKAVPPLRAFMGHPAKVHNPATQFVYQTVPEDSLKENLHGMASDLEILIRDRLLAEANVESFDANSVTYFLRPDPTCRPLPGDGDPAVIDQDCARDLTRLQVRIVMAKDSDGVRLAIQVGMQRAEMVGFVVHSNMLAVESKLAQTKQAIDIVNATLGMDSPTDFGLQVQGGTLRLSLTKLAEQKFQLGLSVLEAVSLVSLDNTGAPTVSFSSAAQLAGPVLGLTGDGVGQTLELSTNLGKTVVKTDWDPGDVSPPNQDLEVSIGGYSWSVLLSDLAGTLAISNFGWGDEQSSVEVRNVPIALFDLNPLSGRRANVGVTLTVDDRPHFAITPELAVNVALNFAAVAAEFSDPPPDFVLNESYSFALGGAAPTVVEFAPENQLTNFGGGIQMVAGTLKLASSKGASVTVPQGQCLVSKDAADGDHPLLGTLTAGPCQ